VESEVQTDCNGNKWQLVLYPGGRYKSTEQGWVGLYLFAVEIKSSLNTVYTLDVKDANGAVYGGKDGDELFELGIHDNWGYYEYTKRAEILDPNNNVLKDGALCVDVTIQVKDEKADHYKVKRELSNKMLKLLKSGERSDGSFKVGESTFSVHSLIIQNNAPILAKYLDQDNTSCVIIEGISPEVFQHVLNFVYAEKYPSDEEIFNHGSELIDAANRYELTGLKLTVEHVLVRERILTRENVSDYILFADAQSCPLLKEYAMAYFLLNAKQVLKHVSSQRLRESSELLSEIVMTMAESNTDDETLSVNELRLELGKRKLDVDGSKEALLSRLEEAKRQKTE